MGLFVDANGKLYVDSNGKLYDCDDCFCGPPSTCPCGTWPVSPAPGDFPCGGLNYQYTAANGLVSPFDASLILRRVVGYDTSDGSCSGNISPGFNPWDIKEWRFQSSFNLTATTTSCRWQGTQTLQTRESTDAGATFSSWFTATSNAVWRIDLGVTKWVLSSTSGGTAFGPYDNTVTAFPPGSYLDPNNGCSTSFFDQLLTSQASIT